MAKASLHQEWISLLEISGPFLSQKILRDAFPQGLHRLDSTPQRARLREFYAQWEQQAADPAIHTAWVECILTEMLQLNSYGGLLEKPAVPDALRVRLPGSLEMVSPDYVFVNPAEFPPQQARQPRLLIQVYPRTQGLHKPLYEAHTGQNPVQRMAELCRMTGIPLGLVSNGEDWIGVHAPLGETSTSIQWQAALWVDEQVTFRAFLNLFGVDRLLGPEELTLEALYRRSLEDQFELTDQLGRQVREAVEILVHTLDRLDANQDQRLLRDVPEQEVYEAALTVMMRLVLMFCAEERGLFPIKDPLYRENYALSTLGAELREAADQKSEDVLQYQTDAWNRLLATFRLVYAGAGHDLLKIPAYGGSLFDPDRFPFLEGRRSGTTWRQVQAEPLAVDNRTVLHLLESLQVVDFKEEGEKRRVSFRALDPEQIGYIYEGLLDHTAIRATEPILGLKGSKSKGGDHEPEIPLSRLEQIQAEGEDALVALLQSTCKRSAATLRKELTMPLADTQKLKIACYNDEVLLARVLPFARLLREDSFKLPFVVNTGGVVVTEGVARASSGTHYTPRFLCEEVVQHTLDPLVHHGPAEGLPPEQWLLKPPAELLALRICDLAMGSGAFLVQACRYLAEKLVAAWDAAVDPTSSRPQVMPEGALSQGEPQEVLLPDDPHQRLVLARRLVAMRCLYGVDKNPMAVEMAKLSLWLITLAQDQPFTFLDHHLRCGDSLLGLTDLQQLQRFHLDPSQGRQHYSGGVQHILRVKLKNLLIQRSKLAGDVLTDWEKEVLQDECEQELDELRLYADLLVGASLSLASKKGKALQEKLAEIAYQIEQVGERPDKSREQHLDELHRMAQQGLGHEPANGEGRRPFHWMLEFPEVLVDPEALEQESELLDSPLFQSTHDLSLPQGFDAIIGNPPFLGGQKLTGTFGTDYREYLVQFLGRGARGSADLCAYFYLRAGSLLRSGGDFGLVATNTIAQGDTRDVGLDQLAVKGTIYHAVPSQKWSGTANLEVALIWWHQGIWHGVYDLQGKSVNGITPSLTVPGKSKGKPYRLASNANRSFQGSVILGLGFTMAPDEAKAWIEQDSKNADVLFPYLNGQDLNSHPEQKPSRWIINFFDWPLDRASSAVGYTGPVAADYPEMLAIVREKVKPDRDQNNRKARRDNWWKYAEQAKGLYKAISGINDVIFKGFTSKYSTFNFVPGNYVYAAPEVVIASSEYALFAVLQSSQHDLWAVHQGSSLETRLRYTTTDCFETFPFPDGLMSAPGAMIETVSPKYLEDIGERYYQYRKQIMLRSQLGLTKTYNCFHDPDDQSLEIGELCRLHVEMDQAVAAAYGWEDLDLGHGFHETKQGLRYTVSEAARLELLDRLLALNHERYAEEVAQGLHKKK
ncbi:MAG: DNA methyltransferase [Candidatus Sericytochromatia bacterium]